MASKPKISFLKKEVDKVGTTRPAAKPTAETARPTYRQGKRLVQAHLPETTCINLKILAAKLGTTNQGLIEEALTDLFAKHRDLLTA